MLTLVNVAGQIESYRNGVEYCQKQIKTNQLKTWEIKEYQKVIEDYVNKLAELLPQRELIKLMMWEDNQLDEALKIADDA